MGGTKKTLCLFFLTRHRAAGSRLVTLENRVIFIKKGFSFFYGVPIFDVSLKVESIGGLFGNKLVHHRLVTLCMFTLIAPREGWFSEPPSSLRAPYTAQSEGGFFMTL